MIRQVMVSHSNISSSTAQFDQVFSHPKDNKVGNVICIHCSPPDHQGKSTHSFQPQLSQSVMSLTSYSNKTACEITITKLIKQIFSCHLLVKSQNIPACRYESNWPSAQWRNLLLFLLRHSSFFNPSQCYKCVPLHK